MRHKLVCFLLLCAAAAGALAFRLPRLGDRPMHADEAVQAARFRQLWLDGRYVYDPNEFHGPTLTYATLPAMWASGRKSFADSSEADYRIVPAIFGAALVLWFWLLADAIGKPAAVCAGLLAAISPAMVFYSRYYIHETLLAFFTLGLIGCGWRAFRSGRLVWFLAAGACAGLMQSTKETGVLAFAAMACASLVMLAWRRLLVPQPKKATCLEQRSLGAWRVAAGIAAAILVAALFLSSFLANPRGPLDGVLAYRPWIGRAGEQSPHAHPWSFYLQLLAYWRVGDGPYWSEGLILCLAAAAFLIALLPAKWNLLPGANLAFARWAAFYTVALTAAYSVIPYKTPWCLLSFLSGMILLAGIGAAALVRAIPTTPLKVLLTLVLLAAAGQLGWQSYRASYVYPADPRNPYVYAHTSPDINRLAQDLRQLARAAPGGGEPVIKVIWSDGHYWPLPWVLRGFRLVGYWTEMPDEPAAPLVIASPTWDAPLTEKLDATHLMTGYYALRPAVLVQLWVRMDVWEAHLKRLGRL